MRRKYKKMSDEKWEQAAEMRKQGKTYEEIAHHFGITKQFVAQHVCGIRKAMKKKIIYP